MSNVLTWENALDDGHEPSLYPYAAELIPMGQFEARLDFKIWAKNTMGVSCYFTVTVDNKRFKLTVFRRKNDEQYMLENETLDFADCPVGVSYLITVAKNKTGNAVFKSAAIVNP
jgi:hypothetical protein